MHRSTSTTRVSEEFSMNTAAQAMGGAIANKGGGTYYHDDHYHHHHSLPTYDPQSDAAKKEVSRAKVAENMVHVIPFVLVLCTIILWFFSHPSVPPQEVSTVAFPDPHACPVADRDSGRRKHLPFPRSLVTLHHRRVGEETPRRWSEAGFSLWASSSSPTPLSLSPSLLRLLRHSHRTMVQAKNSHTNKKSKPRRKQDIVSLLNSLSYLILFDLFIAPNPCVSSYPLPFLPRQEINSILEMPWLFGSCLLRLTLRKQLNFSEVVNSKHAANKGRREPKKNKRKEAINEVRNCGSGSLPDMGALSI
ncbi:hypothetical protein GW17_00001889 [Ensete ventricosum]|nr:hypothetical protein GW17_00001889 [Ensete ventricosum]